MAPTILSIEQIIEERLLFPVFQPIIDITVPEICGYEALIRGPKNSVFYNSHCLFNEAKSKNLIIPLEHLCLELACQAYKERKIQGKLFLNVSPMCLTASNAERHTIDVIRKAHSIDKERIVIELSEQYPLNDYNIISESMHHLRENGFELAIDDLGAGYSSLRVWSEFSPEFVKIDRHFIKGIDHDPIKYQFVRSIQEISRSLGCKVIAEGIETEEELKSIRTLGITHAQGFLLGKPDRFPITSLPESLNSTVSSLRQVVYHQHRDRVVELMDYLEPFNYDDKLEFVAERMRQNTRIDGVPVVKNHIPIGVITRKKIFEVFLGRYGRELHAKKKVVDYINRDVLIIDKHNSLSEASRMFSVSNQVDMNIDIIITDTQKYIGVVKTKKLLKKITEQQIMSARHSNPLSLLPGNVPIYEWIDALLEKKQNFRLAYFDLNNFKPYNDTYGYARGDEVILLLAEIIKESIHPETDRVGHIGGDDFVVIFQSDDWEERCAKMLARFRAEIKSFYNEEDLNNEGIYSQDRRGECRFFPLLSVAVGVVDPDWQICQSHHDVATLATDAKHEAKKQGGNTLFLSRRRSPTQMFAQQESFGT